jgi:hypothetical protein
MTTSTPAHPGQTGLGAAAIEDRLAIINLLAAYAHYANVGDLDGWSSTFAEEATYQVSSPGAPGAPLPVTEIVKLEIPHFARYSAVHADPYLGERAVYRIANPFVVRQSEDSAEVLCDLMIVRMVPRGPDPRIMLTGGFSGTLVKRDGAWRILRWRIETSRESDADWAIKPNAAGD